jgi:hypothetical protein
MVLGSGIRDPEKTYYRSRIPDPGVKKHPIPDPGSRIRIRNTASIQFLFTADVYSDEHTVVVILLIKFRNGTNRSPRFPLFLRRFKYGKS